LVWYAVGDNIAWVLQFVSRTSLIVWRKYIWLFPLACNSIVLASLGNALTFPRRVWMSEIVFSHFLIMLDFSTCEIFWHWSFRTSWGIKVVEAVKIPSSCYKIPFSRMVILDWISFSRAASATVFYKFWFKFWISDSNWSCWLSKPLRYWVGSS